MKQVEIPMKEFLKLIDEGAIVIKGFGTTPVKPKNLRLQIPKNRVMINFIPKPQGTSSMTHIDDVLKRWHRIKNINNKL